MLARAFCKAMQGVQPCLKHGRTQSLQNIYVLSVRIISQCKKVCLQGLFCETMQGVQPCLKHGRTQSLQNIYVLSVRIISYRCHILQAIYIKKTRRLTGLLTNCILNQHYSYSTTSIHFARNSCSSFFSFTDCEAATMGSHFVTYCFAVSLFAQNIERYLSAVSLPLLILNIR